MAPLVDCGDAKTMDGDMMLHRQHEHTDSRSSLTMHTISVDGRRTTIRIEPVIWAALRNIARQQKIPIKNLISTIDRSRTASSLTSAIRAYVVAYLLTQVPHDALPGHLFHC